MKAGGWKKRSARRQASSETLPIFHSGKIFALISFCFSVFAPHSSFSQTVPFKFTRDDTLRGAQTPVRTCYDVTSYDLQLAVDVKKRFINGSNVIRFRVVNDFDSMQIDLFARMKIDKIVFEGNRIEISPRFKFCFCSLSPNTTCRTSEEISVSYSGTPLSAKNPPWDAGFVWKKDMKGRDWIGVVCEGIGASHGGHVKINSLMSPIA